MNQPKHLQPILINFVKSLHACVIYERKKEHKYNKLLQYTAVRVGEMQGALYEINILRFMCFHGTYFVQYIH